MWTIPQAESFETSFEGSLGQEMAGIAEVEAAVAAAAAEVEQKDKEIAELHARIAELTAKQGKEKENSSAGTVQSPGSPTPFKDSAGLYQRNKARALERMNGFGKATPTRVPTPGKGSHSGLPNTIVRMQQTLTNLRSCASKMKESGRSSVKQRMELSERAMHAYRELKELTSSS